MKVNCYFFSSLYVSFFFFQCNHRSDYHRYRDNRRNSRDYRQKEWVLDPSYIPFTHLIYLTSERLYYILIFFATLHYWMCMKNKYSFFLNLLQKMRSREQWFIRDSHKCKSLIIHPLDMVKAPRHTEEYWKAMKFIQCKYLRRKKKNQSKMHLLITPKCCVYDIN